MPAATPTPNYSEYTELAKRSEWLHWYNARIVAVSRGSGEEPSLLAWHAPGREKGRLSRAQPETLRILPDATVAMLSRTTLSVSSAGRTVVFRARDAAWSPERVSQSVEQLDGLAQAVETAARPPPEEESSSSLGSLVGYVAHAVIARSPSWGRRNSRRSQSLRKAAWLLALFFAGGGWRGRPER